MKKFSCFFVLGVFSMQVEGLFLLLIMIGSVVASVELRPVEPLVTKLPTSVRFNVETLGPTPAERHGYKFHEPWVERETLIARSYDKKQEGVFPGSSLYDVASDAFKRHYPLVIRPDDVWLTVSAGFAEMISDNAKKLRDKFVKHQGKVRLTVLTSPSPKWEDEVFHALGVQIAKHIGEDKFSQVTKPFSTSQKTDAAVFQVVLMKAMDKYFEYSVIPLCGIPWIELQGTEDDWKSIIERFKYMSALVETPEWERALLPILQEFLNAYQGNVNHGFWQNMIKVFHASAGSGSVTKINGWIPFFYPSLQKLWGGDIDADKFPNTLSKVDFLFTEDDLPGVIYAGFFGSLQDPETKAVSLRTGWMVTLKNK
jgi:hypothetical protein